jgi:hypothetical protein
VDTRLKPARLAYVALALLTLTAVIILARLQSGSVAGRQNNPAFSQLCSFATLQLCGTSTAPGASTAEIHFSLPSGYYEQDVDLHLSSPHPGAAIYFTTDGSDPTPQSGTLYSGPIHIPAGEPRTAVLRARAFLADGKAGPLAGATYFMNVDTEIPIMSLVIDPRDLWDEDSGIFANPHFYGREWERKADVFYYDPQQGTGLAAPAGVRVHGARSRDYDKKSLRLYFRGEYGLPYVEYRIFPDSDKTRFKRLVLHDGGQDLPAVSFNGTLLRNELVGNLVRQAGGYATYSRPTLLFINGQLWGIYNIRERIDDRYLAEEFQIDDADLLSGFENDLQASYGDSAHWDHLIEYVAANDLTKEEAYLYVQTQVDLDNFIDYALIQIITANADWPHNNQLKFRDRANGSWHWMFWDSDFAFGLMTDSYIEKNMFTHILDHEDELQQQSSLLLRKLLENPDFKTRFLNRLADLLNTVFASDNVLPEIDRLAGSLEQDIPFEIRRWPGSGDWDAGVEYMREFARRRPDIVRSQTLEAFDLSGTATLTINQPDNGGYQSPIRNPQSQIIINGGTPLSGQELPWQGEYFQGVDIQLTAVPAPGYHFVEWACVASLTAADATCPDLPPNPEVTLSLDGDLSLTPRFEHEN